MRATVSLPGSKSLTNRALMAGALTALGSAVDTWRDDWQVTPGPFDAAGTVDCGLAGTVMRFVPPVAALSSATVHFDGDPHARTRPMRAPRNIPFGLEELLVLIEDPQERLRLQLPE